jgi:RNA polymerase sigma-70 factor (ECF subfamily)
MTVEPSRAIPTSEQVARDFRARLLRFIRARVESAADAEDIVQDVLLRMHRSVQTLAKGERLGAWLFQVARNAIVDHYRARGRSAAVLDPAIPAEAVADAVAGKPEDDPGRFERDATRCLDAFVDRLDVRYAEALRLVDLEGLTHKAAAARLGLTVPGVKSRVQRARASLKKTLGDCCAFDFEHADGLVAFEAGSATGSCAGGCRGRAGAGGCSP